MVNLSIHGAVLLLPHVPSWHAQGQLCFSASDCRATGNVCAFFVKAFACLGIPVICYGYEVV
jgi:hypothetical protein